MVGPGLTCTTAEHKASQASTREIRIDGREPAAPRRGARSHTFVGGQGVTRRTEPTPDGQGRSSRTASRGRHPRRIGRGTARVGAPPDRPAPTSVGAERACRRSRASGDTPRAWSWPARRAEATPSDAAPHRGRRPSRVATSFASLRAIPRSPSVRGAHGIIHTLEAATERPLRATTVERPHG